ncbi:MAG: FAD-binding oxidoreductase [Patescibacteria group bacterium]
MCGAIFDFLFKKGKKYIVTEVKKMNGQVVQIAMAPKNGKNIKYLPGQFIRVGFNGSVAKPFSLISLPGEKEIVISVKALGDFTTKLQDLHVGALAGVQGPFGKFLFKNFVGKNQIWIAGGIGIMPFLSMSKFLVQDSGSEYKIVLFYCANTKDEAVYIDDLLEYSKQSPNLNVIPFFCDKDGFLSAKEIEETAGDLNGREILMCGPPPMLAALRKQLKEIGVSDRFIHGEEF